MSIRGKGPHTVIVQPRRVERVKGSPVYVDDGPPVRVKYCDVQSARDAATAEEDLAHGVTLLSMRRVYARHWPGDVNALVYFTGDLYETVGEPQRFDRSRRTAHHVITIRRIGPAEAPVVPGDSDGSEAD